jgi:hypothetical protein
MAREDYFREQKLILRCNLHPLPSLLRRGLLLRNANPNTLGDCFVEDSSQRQVDLSLRGVFDESPKVCFWTPSTYSVGASLAMTGSFGVATFFNELAPQAVRNSQ